MATFLSLFVNGVAYGMILFLISSGLTVTLGIMRVVNLAHCGFAMIGGYAAMTIVSNTGMGLFVALPIAVVITMAIGFLLERTVYRIVYKRDELGQILITIGLAFVMIATMNLLFGSVVYAVQLPSWLQGNVRFGEVVISSYRLFLIAVSLAVAAGLWLILERTSFGMRLHAAIDNPAMARAVGINVGQVLSVTFMLGCGLAAIGGALGTQILPLEPYYALKYLILLLMVVSVGGLGSLKGSLIAALLLGLLDTLGRFYFPEAGGFIIYVVVATLLLFRPAGLFARG